jgi:hypothetical protein
MLRPIAWRYFFVYSDRPRVVGVVAEAWEVNDTFGFYEAFRGNL